MANCEKLISKGIDINCDTPVTRGVEPNGVIMNRSEVDFTKSTFAASSKNTLESLVMKTGKKGYPCYVPGKTPFTGLKTTLNVGTYVNTFNNEIPIVILDNSPDVCANVIDGLANGTFVIVSENKHKGENKEAAFQVYGFYQGLTATTLENDKYSEETEGGWKAVLTEERAPKSGLFLFKTDYDATKSLVESLTAEPTPAPAS